ncbi:transmembrane protein fend-like [Uranotaenia lowii]|uniref:transmembrane protein fend-like n=1 Tax=Uranotaenia lowii TaxID=190385 RepID=UPI00247A3C32|nr:transmembrane protein fend-like [Uranotaenia lowii]
MAPSLSVVGLLLLMVCSLTALISASHASVVPKQPSVTAAVTTSEARRNVVLTSSDPTTTELKKETTGGEERPPSAWSLTVATEKEKREEETIRSCREACSKKHSINGTLLCSQLPECSMCQKSCEAAQHHNNLDHLRASTPRKLLLVLLEMTRIESLVTAEVAWVHIPVAPTDPGNRPRQQFQCLVTWEVAGGGLMGNLLTESARVQLSLWPDTKYRVQVTCRNRRTNALVRSSPITLNTSTATEIHPSSFKHLSVVKSQHSSPFLKQVAIKTSSNEMMTQMVHQPQQHQDQQQSNYRNHQNHHQQEVATEFHSQQQQHHLTAVWPHLANDVIVIGSSRQQQQDAVLLGVFGAILGVIFVLLTGVIFVKRKKLQKDLECEEKREQIRKASAQNMMEVLHV